MVVSMMIVAVAVIAAVVLLARTEKIISFATIDGKGMLDEGRRGRNLHKKFIMTRNNFSRCYLFTDICR